MQTYVFECSSCLYTFEVKQNINSEHEADCPDCGEPAKRVYSVPEVRYDFPSLDATAIMNREGKWNY